MKAYVPRLLVGVKIPYPELISCKEHRVRALISVKASSVQLPSNFDLSWPSSWHKAAVLYAGVAYGLWTQAFVSTRGNKSKLKVGSSCTDVLHFTQGIDST